MKFSKQIESLITEFRGLPAGSSKPGSRTEPIALENLLVILEEQYKLEDPSPERSLVENWEAIFGPNLAGRCNPVRIKGTTLTISVTNPTLRSEVKFRQRQLIQKIQKLPYCEKITEIVARG